MKTTQLANTIISLALVAGSFSTARAELVVKEAVVHETTTSVDIKLDETTVLCSWADYSGEHLKVLIPQLAGITLLDHQNFGAGAPCVAAGMCMDGRRPENIIDVYKPTESVEITVKAVRVDDIDTEAATCNTFLTERVDVNIRDFPFSHERHVQLGSRPFSDCMLSSGNADETGGKADEAGGADTEPASGGCSTGTGSTGATFLLVMLGAAIAIRRRRVLPLP